MLAIYVLITLMRQSFLAGICVHNDAQSLANLLNSWCGTVPRILMHIFEPAELLAFVTDQTEW